MCMSRVRLPQFLLTAFAVWALALPALACGPTRAPEVMTAVAPAPVEVVPAIPPSMPVAVVPAPLPPRMVGWGPAPGLVAGASSAPAISGTAAIVIDEASGVTLFEKDVHAQIPPASLTKIMTALVALERGRLDEVVEVKVDSRVMRGSTVMGLVPGERVTLEDLLYGMMLPSGNDAALAVADHISGSMEAFVVLMNRRAAELGMVNTQFSNPHGLDRGTHYSSAYDLAALARTAMQRQDFRTIADTKYRVVTGAIATYHLGTLNPLYGRVAGVDGVKTGYTRRARQTLVGSVTRDGHRVFVVVLQSPDRAADGTALLDWAFTAHTWPSANTVAAADAATVPGT
jgi:D-alanyl-D-alanine carboxypeptidase (penicillin-binding protein 5/6)